MIANYTRFNRSLMGACHVSPARHCVHFTLSIHSSTLTLSIRINFFRLHQVFTPTSIFPPASLVSTLINFVRPCQLVLPGWFCNVCINILSEGLSLGLAFILEGRAVLSRCGWCARAPAFVPAVPAEFAAVCCGGWHGRCAHAALLR